MFVSYFLFLFFSRHFVYSIPGTYQLKVKTFFLRILYWILLAVCRTAGAAVAAVVEITRTHELCGGCASAVANEY